MSLLSSFNNLINSTKKVAKSGFIFSNKKQKDIVKVKQATSKKVTPKMPSIKMPKLPKLPMPKLKKKHKTAKQVNKANQDKTQSKGKFFSAYKQARAERRKAKKQKRLAKANYNAIRQKHVEQQAHEYAETQAEYTQEYERQIDKLEKVGKQLGLKNVEELEGYELKKKNVTREDLEELKKRDFAREFAQKVSSFGGVADTVVNNLINDLYSFNDATAESIISAIQNACDVIGSELVAEEILSLDSLWDFIHKAQHQFYERQLVEFKDALLSRLGDLMSVSPDEIESPDFDATSFYNQYDSGENEV